MQKQFSQDWLKAQNDISDSSRQEDTKKEIKKDHHLEEYLKIQLIEWVWINCDWEFILYVYKPGSINKEASIPEERLCSDCKRNCIEDKKHFLTDYKYWIQ